MMKAERYVIGVVIEERRTVTALVEVRANSQPEAVKHAEGSMLKRCLQPNATDYSVGVAGILDWEAERYAVNGIDNSQDWSDGYDIDVDLTDEPTEQEADLLARQRMLPL